MRKLILLMFFIPVMGWGQISVTENKIKTAEVGRYKYSDFNKGSMTYYFNGTDTTISLMCMDQKYQSLQRYETISFKGGVKEKQQLYDALLSCYADENKDNKDYMLTIKLGEKSVGVYKSGKLVCMLFDNAKFSFAKGNIDTLFGMR